MRFLNPAGLWLLLGVPILIIIYLIKAHHEERQVSSTYIWKLSEKFMKKRLVFIADAYDYRSFTYDSKTGYFQWNEL